MGGKILDYEAKDILKKGIQQGEIIGRQQGEIIGRQQGEKTGKIQALVDLIKDGLLSINEAAKRLNMDESELEKYL